MLLTRRARKFVYLPLGRKKLLAQSLMLIATVRLALWLLPYRWIHSFVAARVSDNERQELVKWSTIEEVVHSVKVCSRLIPYASCLTQALTTQLLLSINGQSAGLKIGVNKDQQGKLIAHAWLEVENKVIIGRVANLKNYFVLT